MLYLTFFSPVKISFRHEISWRFSEKMIVLQRKFFIMLEKFHACFAEKKWLLFMVKKKKKKWGINFESSVHVLNHEKIV